MDCELAQRHLDAYVDGELSPTAVLELEAHVDGCEACGAHVEFANRLKRTLRQELAAPPAPARVQASVQRALLAGESGSTRLRRYNHAAAWGSLAVAAALLVWFGGRQVWSPWASGETAIPPGGVQVPRQASIYGDIVSRHQEPEPVEIDTPEPESAERWFSGKLGFHVRPVAFSEPQVRLVGARLSHVGRHRAAKLYYDVGDRRLTAVAFEATPEVLGMLEQEQRPDVQVVRMGNRTVRYHRVHGYTVPIIEHNGILYGFTGDLDERRMLRLVGSVQLR
ncbi:MAG: zf-HC2 domain-containing protein [Myxococcales bacterium]|nr:zf-HC2 domain-containing protein [Myxococcales bacterium]MDD9967725.1 zf-HC2 domain-containing protein [Myxococcales bacterium]